MASPLAFFIKKRYKMTLSGDHEMYQQLLKSVDNLKTEFAKQGQKFTSLEILSFSVKQFDSKINVHDISETVKCDRNNADEDLLVTTASAAENLMKTAGTLYTVLSAISHWHSTARNRMDVYRNRKLDVPLVHSQVFGFHRQFCLMVETW